jgi:hypothetical protein
VVRVSTRAVPPPAYNPSVLVLRVRELLAREGIAVVDLGPAAAVIAASDLLRALGVEPANAPMRPPTMGVCAERVAGQDIG